jgi:hypothetical protein
MSSVGGVPSSRGQQVVERVLRPRRPVVHRVSKEDLLKPSKEGPRCIE